MRKHPLWESRRCPHTPDPVWDLVVRLDDLRAWWQDAAHLPFVLEDTAITRRLLQCVGDILETYERIGRAADQGTGGRN